MRSLSLHGASAHGDGRFVQECAFSRAADGFLKDVTR